MGNVIMIALVWISAIVGWRIMKKIQPEESKLYLGYSIFICILVTSFGVIYLFQV